MRSRRSAGLRFVHALYGVTIAFSLPGLDGRAVEVAITNGSFEIPILSESQMSEGSPVGWLGNGIITVMNPADDFFNGSSDAGPGPSTLDGRNAVAINYGGELIYEDPTLLTQPNFIYTLTVLAGHRSGVPFGNGSVSLLAGPTLLTVGIPNPPSGIFVPFSLSYTSPPAGPTIGQPLRIKLEAPSAESQVWFDNVHLNAQDQYCSPHRARATAQLFNGIFVGATLIDFGCGYTNPPTVTIQGGGGTGATATARIFAGSVTEIRVTSGGCCYTNLPTIIIDSPPRPARLAIRVSKVMVTADVIQGRRYLVESSFDSATWTPTGPAVTASSDILKEEFDVNVTGQFFRIRQVLP